MTNVQFSDSTFNEADWQTEIVTSGNGGTVAVNQSNATADVGSFQEITMRHCEFQIQRLGQQASATRYHSHYPDIAHPKPIVSD